MKCKVCGKDTMKQDGERYVCENCGAVAVKVDNTEELAKQDSDETTQKVKTKKPKSKAQETLEFFLPIIIALLVALFLKHCVFANAVVPTGSMLNTIQEGDRVIASRLVKEPERGDIFIFKYPDDYAKGKTTYYVKRVIGLPGETVTITGGQVYITGSDGKAKMLDETSYVVGTTYEGNHADGVYKVPENCYFVMGDNREDSGDSRYWSTTNYVDKDLLVGKVMFRYYPSIQKYETVSYDK